MAVLLLLTVATGAFIRVGQAVTFQGPTNAPPQGNIPVTIWNRVTTGTQQGSAAIDIDGGGPPPAPVGLVVGNAALDMGLSAAGQNLIYGVADPAKMNAGDNLILLQAPSGTNRLSIDKLGNALLSGSFSSNGSISSAVGTVSGTYGGWFGALGIDFGVGTTGQNVIYGGASYAGMHPTGDFLLKLETGVGPTPTVRMTVNRDGNLYVDGMSVFGSAARVVGVGQNLVYGNIDTTSTGNLMLLQTESVDRFKVDAAGNATSAGTITAANLNADACFGPTFVGRTATLYRGDLDTDSVAPTPANGYLNVNALCSSFGAGAHVCSSAEMMNSIKCAGATSPIRNQAADSSAWVQDGPPGYTAPSNDCRGWTAGDGGSLGRMWKFNETVAPATLIGRGYLTTCQQFISFACCK